MIGKIAFDKAVVESIIEGKTIQILYGRVKTINKDDIMSIRATYNNDIELITTAGRKHIIPVSIYKNSMDSRSSILEIFKSWGDSLLN